MTGRRAGKSIYENEALGRWIKTNPGKPFMIATTDGVYAYTGTFTSQAEINAARDQQERLKERFFYDEAADIDPAILAWMEGRKP